MLSTAATEYYKASEACREVAFIRSIVEDFYKSKLAPSPLLIDNQAAICMSKLPQFTEKQKALSQPVFERLKSALFGKFKFSDINDK